MTPEQKSFFFNEKYFLLCEKAKMLENDITSDFESTDPNIDAEALSFARNEILTKSTNSMALQYCLQPKN